jgi:CCR4-NOT transcription complex subunit 2
MSLNSNFGMRNFGQPGGLSQTDFKGNGTDGGIIPNMLKTNSQKTEKKETILQTMQSRKAQQKKVNEDKYGLMGLLDIIKMEDKDLNVLSLGFDLTTLGLNLNSPEYLYSTFASPWNDNSTRIQPEFAIPSCYFLQTPPTFNKHFGKYQDETLFYMFYSMPKDVCQVLAAKELNKRKWMYHTFHKIWLTKAPLSGTEQIQTTQTYEKGPVIYFDYHAWKKVKRDDFVLEYDKVM